ncbi:hypothetical protein GCM10008967_30380 [Bacillus carboniphilus]|uniref:GrpB family protein n=1 Tax=Bacillus carboniphilus TaxID=86663 RepID=A0ABN0WIQ7_9BACI
MRRTNVQPWSEEWGQKYKVEASALKEIFKDIIIDIFHIGSTSIPTIGFAKPIIDILIVVEDIEQVDPLNNKMTQLGYSPKSENGIPGRRYFSKGGEQRTHHVHVYHKGNENIQIHLNFQAYLLENPDIAKQYGQLKQSLLEKYPDIHHKYQEEKQEFVDQLVKDAQKWALKEQKNENRRLV